MHTDTHFHYICAGYDRERDDGSYVNLSTVDTVAPTAEAALAQAANQVPGKNIWRITSAIQHHDNDATHAVGQPAMHLTVDADGLLTRVVRWFKRRLG